MAKAEIRIKLPWIRPEELEPNDGEHIAFIFKHDTDWHDGNYRAEKRIITKQAGSAGTIPVYECVPFDAVAYWMRILLPEDFK